MTTLIGSCVSGEIAFDSNTYLFMTQLFTSIPEDVLKNPVGTLEASVFLDNHTNT